VCKNQFEEVVMRVVLVLGDRLLPSGDVNDAFKARMCVGVSRLLRSRGDLLVISGGTTRAGFPSEAEASLSEVPPAMLPKVLLETRAKSTVENILYTKELLDGKLINSLTVVTSAAHVPRTKKIMKRLWADVYPKTSFKSVGRATRMERVVEFILRRLDTVDPKGRTIFRIKQLLQSK
jgi:hypothetical protein